MSIIFYAIALVISLAMTAFFAGSETALVSLNRAKIDRIARRNKRAKIVKNIVNAPERMLGMTLIGTNLMHVMASELGLLMTIAIVHRLEFAEEMPVDETIIAASATTVLILIFSEILPKTIFRARSEQLALRYAYLLRLSELLLSVPTTAVTFVTNRLVNAENRNRVPIETRRNELRLLARIGEQTGIIERMQQQMIYRLLDLRKRTIGHIMTPLTSFVAISNRSSLSDFLKIAAQFGFSRIPIYEKHFHEPIGIVHLLDVLYSDSRNVDDSIEPFIRRELLFMAVSTKIDVALRELQKSSQHAMVFVVDEYGGIVGLVTIKDLVEEIVGKIADEYADNSKIRIIGPKLIECDGRAEIITLNDKFSLQIPMGDYETIAGYILDRYGRFPKSGDEIKLKNLLFTIVLADHRRIHRVRISQERIL